MTIKNLRPITITITTALLLVACGETGTEDSATTAADAVPKIDAAASKTAIGPEDGNVTTVKPSAPVQISYRTIGQAVVGQPVAIDLRFDTSLGAQSFDVSYRINDETALQFAEAQAKRVTVAPSIEDKFAAQQVRVIPMREGRLYLNVAVELHADNGTFSSVMAVPVEVGETLRQTQENGVVTTDESGELIRTLPAKQD